jgi:DNA (cytosine-5)-methyltransferase 1
MPRNGARGDLHSNALYRPGERPLHTVTAKNTDGYLVTPSLVRYSHGGKTLGVTDPMPTIATEKAGVFAHSAPYLCPMNNGRSGQRPRTRTPDRPLMTVPASKSPAGVATPYLVSYYGRDDAHRPIDRPLGTQGTANTFGVASPVVRPFIDDYEGPAAPVTRPLGTITSRDRFALVVPDLYPWGLDVRYRMLQPRELQRAQGFPEDYDILGNKRDTTKQIGNAVPVNLAQSLVESLLGDRLPALTDYVDDGVAPADGVERGVVSDD